MKIAVVGVGYVGLVSAACFAEFGVHVTAVDQDENKIARLLKGEIPIFEPGLSDLVARGLHNKTITFTTDLAPAVAEADAIFIAVGTPTRRGDGYADLSYVYQCARDIAKNLTHYTVVVTKSTVPVGTGQEIKRIIKELRPDVEFDVCSNPEFLREGAAINDFMRPDRVVIGCESERAAEIMRAIYRPLYLIETPIVMTTLETSELTKYAANAFLAVKITFINEIADLCEKVGADIQTVSKGIGLDNRIGGKFLHAGPGYGGSCFPKDTLALVKTAQDHDAPVRIIETVVAVNDKRKKSMTQRIIKACGGSVAGKTIAVLGLAFKPNTDDMRDSVSLDVVPALKAAGAIVRCYDPESMEEAKKNIPDITCTNDPYDAMNGADAVVILTEWNEFRAMDLEKIHGMLKSPTFIDLRNIYKPTEMKALGFDYHSIGR